MMKKLVSNLFFVFATFVVGGGARPMLAADPIPNAKAVVTVKDFDFFATGNNPVGVAVDHNGDLKVGILGLPILGPRSSTPLYTVTPEGETSNFFQSASGD